MESGKAVHQHRVAQVALFVRAARLHMCRCKFAFVVLLVVLGGVLFECNSALGATTSTATCYTGSSMPDFSTSSTGAECVATISGVAASTTYQIYANPGVSWDYTYSSFYCTSTGTLPLNEFNTSSALNLLVGVSSLSSDPLFASVSYSNQQSPTTWPSGGTTKSLWQASPNSNTTWMPPTSLGDEASLTSGSGTITGTINCTVRFAFGLRPQGSQVSYLSSSGDSLIHVVSWAVGVLLFLCVVGVFYRTFGGESRD